MSGRMAILWVFCLVFVLLMICMHFMSGGVGEIVKQHGPDADFLTISQPK